MTVIAHAHELPSPFRSCSQTRAIQRKYYLMQFHAYTYLYKCILRAIIYTFGIGTAGFSVSKPHSLIRHLQIISLNISFLNFTYFLRKKIPYMGACISSSLCATRYTYTHINMKFQLCLLCFHWLWPHHHHIHAWWSATRRNLYTAYVSSMIYATTNLRSRNNILEINQFS